MTDLNLSENARQKLESLVKTIEALEGQKSEISEEIKFVFAEAKALGYDVKALRDVIRFRKKDEEQRQEEEMILHTYLAALGEV